MKLLPRSWFARDAVDLAPKLLGKIVKMGSCAGIIVETEAYTTDPASHAYRITPRSAAMRASSAVEPVEGIAVMKKRRDIDALKNLCSGPAKFCQAFGITGKDNGAPVSKKFGIYDAPEVKRSDLFTSGRIGIRSGTALPLRFYIKNNPFVSR